MIPQRDFALRQRQKLAVQQHGGGNIAETEVVNKRTSASDYFRSSLFAGRFLIFEKLKRGEILAEDDELRPLRILIHFYDVIAREVMTGFVVVLGVFTHRVGRVPFDDFRVDEVAKGKVAIYSDDGARAFARF